VFGEQGVTERQHPADVLFGSRNAGWRSHGGPAAARAYLGARHLNGPGAAIVTTMAKANETVVFEDMFLRR
jgi:hypothetical protein